VRGSATEPVVWNTEMYANQGMPPLIGRESELARLRRLLEGALVGESAALVVRGEAGIGKSALLSTVAEGADRARVIRVLGVETEMELTYASLHQLCLPLLDGLDSLPPPQCSALGTAFGLSMGSAPDRFLVGLAVLSLLSNAAEPQPIVCIVDDAQWLDRASAQVLSFVARRLQAESVLMLFAEREHARRDELGSLPELRLRALPDAAACELLVAANVGPLDVHVRDRIIAETRGNPLALLELTPTLASGKLAGGFAVTAELRKRLEENFRRQVAELPPSTQQLLLVAAAEPTGDPILLARAAPALDIPLEAAAPAEAEGLVALGTRVAFRHPLLRSAIYAAARPDARRAAHEALAAATDPAVDFDRRAWHRAHATAVPDEDVSSELEQSASRARARGGLAAAAAFLERAAALTPDPALRAGRALAAADVHHQAGDVAAAERLVLEAESGALDELQRARTERLRARIAFRRGQPEGTRLIFSALRRLQALDAAPRELYLEVVETAGGLGQTAAMLEAARAIPAAWALQPEHPLELLLAGWAKGVVDGYPSAADLIGRGLSAYRAGPLSTEEELGSLWLATRMATTIWDDEAERALVARHVELARAAGALPALIAALEVLASSRGSTGAFADAKALMGEAELLAAAIEMPPNFTVPIVLSAWCDPPERALERVQAFIDHWRRNGREEFVGFAERAAAAVALNGCGDYRSALEALERARQSAAGGLTGPALTELVEAAARCGDYELAESGRAEVAESTRVGTDWARGIAARADALVSDDHDAETFYVESIDRLGRTGRRPSLARSHLVYGEWLRRRKRIVDAREQLRLAYDLLSSMGAVAFTERARRELVATGAKIRKRVNETRADLTPQEAQIARLAAQGLTNPEIGAQLFLSPRTVEYHLHKVYSKHGIGSRRELHTVVGAL
jgi:DNA-binding CsgD family transcriptional regulator